MRLPRIFRTTPFRLTLLFLALFASAASAFLAYIYVATAGEATRRTDQEITREMQSLVAAYDRAFQARLADEILRLPPGAALEQAMLDNARLRDQARACASPAKP